MVIGRSLSGISSALLFILPATFSNAWFPPHQLATALSLPIVGSSLGGFTAPIVFGHLLPASTIDSNYTAFTISENSIEDSIVDTIFIAHMVVFTVILLMCTVMFCFVVTNYPPSPPSRAQETLMKRKNHARDRKNFEETLEDIRKVVTNRSFWFINLASICSSSVVVVISIIQPTMIRMSLPDIGNTAVAYVSSATVLASGLGSLASGWILDRFQSYKAFSLVGEYMYVVLCYDIFHVPRIRFSNLNMSPYSDVH